MRRKHFIIHFFFFNDTATTEIYTLSLHDALPIYKRFRSSSAGSFRRSSSIFSRTNRSEEHTSELQSRGHLVCRLLLEKKKKILSNLIQDFIYLLNKVHFNSTNIRY